MTFACASRETEAIEIVQRSLKDDGPFIAEPLSGGFSGSSLIKVHTSEQACVVRFWNRQWAKYFPQDLACQLIASDAGYGPQVFFTDEAAYITLMQYVHPEAYPEIQIRLQALVDLLKKIHTGPAVPKGIDKATDLDESIEAVEKLSLQFLDLDVIRAVKDAVFNATRHNVRCVACHRDLHPGNLLYTQGRFFAIDYTWGGMDDPHSDLATVAIFHCATLEEEKLLLELYLGHAPSPVEVARLSLMKLPTKIFYGLELLILAPASILSSRARAKAAPKCYMNLGRHGGSPPSPAEVVEYAVSILSEVVDYSQSEQYTKDLALMQNAATINEVHQHNKL